MKKSPFKLYPEPEKTTFEYADYTMLMFYAAGLKRVLEIGPGISTYALIEAGVEKIVTLEHTEEWRERAVNSFKDYPQVEVGSYEDIAPVAKADLEGEFEMAFVDSPKGFHGKLKGINGIRKIHPGMEDCSRLNTCLLALEYAPVVYLHDAYRPVERATAGRISGMGHKVEYMNCGSKVGILKITRADHKPEFADTTGKAKAIWPRHDNNWSTALSKT